MTGPVADLELRAGHAVLSACLDAAARAELHPRRVTLPSRGDELVVLGVEVCAVDGDTAKVRVHIRYRAFVGWTGVVLSIFLGALIGTFIFLPLSLMRRKQLVPFGIFLALGAAIAYLWGPALINWYARTYLVG